MDGKAGDLGDKVKISREADKIVVGIKNHHFSKRYLKYLTKKFLKSQHLRDHIRVVALKKESYSLKYFEKDAGDDEDEE